MIINFTGWPSFLLKNEYKVMAKAFQQFEPLDISIRGRRISSETVISATTYNAWNGIRIG